VYYAELLNRSGLGWVVLFSYGRRGAAMQTGTKTATPVEFAKAKKIYDKLVAEKTGKGYTPGEDGVAYRHTSSEERDSGVRCMLLNEMPESDIERLIADDAWGMQEKMDGRRQLVKRTNLSPIDSSTVGINRKGLVVSVATPVHQAMIDIGAQATIDGEAVGDTLYAFDLLEKDGRDLKGKTCSERHAHLVNLLLNQTGAIVLVPMALGAKRKRALFNAVKAGNGEGVVFKRLTALYRAGRPDSGGDALKFKFYATGSFVVACHNARRSVGLALADGTVMGNVTITPNKAVPPVGSIVEVKYLYAFRGGSLFQPQFLVERDDLELQACSAAQLKFKPEGSEDDA
jgi:bifunctional non-homologous end joining protein LigD